MSNETLQPDSRLIFRVGKVFVESKGERKPIEEIVDKNNSGSFIPIQTFKAAAAAYAELDGR